MRRIGDIARDYIAGLHAQERGDALATTVYKLLTEGEREGWVSGLPPDAAGRLEVALNDFCADDPNCPQRRLEARRAGREAA